MSQTLRFTTAGIHPMGSATLVVTPTGATFRVDETPERVHALLTAFDGTRTTAQVLADAPDGFGEVVQELTKEGSLTADVPRTRPVVVVGDEALRRPLVDALQGTGFTVLANLPTSTSPDELPLVPASSPPAAPGMGSTGMGSTGTGSTGTGSTGTGATGTDATGQQDPADADRSAGTSGVTERPPVVVAVRDRFDQEWLTRLDKTMTQTGTPWTQLHLTPQGAVWGPHVEPGRTADYDDVLQRRRCAVDEPDVFDALAATPVGETAFPHEAGLAWLLGSLATDLAAWIGSIPEGSLRSGETGSVTPHPRGRPEQDAAHAAQRVDASQGDGAPDRGIHGPAEHVTACLGLSTEVEAELDGLRLRQHPVLPLPSHHLDGPLRISGEGVQLMISPRTGIIQRTRKIRHHEDVPARLRTVQTHNSSMARVDSEWANDVITGGSTFDDGSAAWNSAVGEAVERYCGNHMGQNPVRWASYDEIVAGGEHAIDPEVLVLYSEHTYNSPGSPFDRFTRDLRVRWVRGRSLTHDRPVWMPVTLVFVNWLAAEGTGHPLTNYMNFSGIAAGTRLDHALVSGIEELVERDATMIWWMNAQPLPGVELTDELRSLMAGAPARAGQRAWLIHLDNQFGIPVMAGLVHHTREDFFTIGFAARPDPEEAGRKAWTEALTLQEGSRDLNSEDSLIRQAIEWGFASYVDLKPFRADRRYLDDYRDDFKDVSDLMCQQQIFLDPRAIEAVRHFTHTPETRRMTDLPRLPDRSLATYRERIEPHGLEICYVDCTTADVAAAGMHAVRVVIPGLVGNAPAAFPLLGRGRVQEVPVQLGWREQALAEADLNYWPIPHA